MDAKMITTVDAKDLDDHTTNQAESTHCETRESVSNNPEKDVNETGRDAEVKTICSDSE